MKNVLMILPFLVAATLAIAQSPDPALPKSRSQASEQWSEDGLRKVQVKGMDVVYLRPEVSLAGYRKVWLGPVTVSFRRGWEQSARIGTRSRVRPEDAQRIRERLTAAVREETLAELARGGYTLVESAGEDVLEVQAAITDLYINAPDLRTAANVEVYAVSAGEMTLVAELRDSLSGEVLVRAYDHARGRESSRPHRIFRSENEQEARAAARAWAETLRKQLDAANQAPPASAE